MDRLKCRDCKPGTFKCRRVILIVMSDGKADRDNHANQCNPNNDAYWESRGSDERPDDWETQVAEDDDESDE